MCYKLLSTHIHRVCHLLPRPHPYCQRPQQPVVLEALHSNHPSPLRITRYTWGNWPSYKNTSPFCKSGSQNSPKRIETTSCPNWSSSTAFSPAITKGVISTFGCYHYMQQLMNPLATTCILDWLEQAHCLWILYIHCRVPISTLMRCGEALDKMFNNDQSSRESHSSFSDPTTPQARPPVTTPHSEPVVPQSKLVEPRHSPSLLEFKRVPSPPSNYESLLGAIHTRPLPPERLPPAKRMCNRGVTAHTIVYCLQCLKKYF